MYYFYNLNKIGPLQSSCSTKTPATSTNALVFYRCYSSCKELIFIQSLSLHTIQPLHQHPWGRYLHTERDLADQKIKNLHYITSPFVKYQILMITYDTSLVTYSPLRYMHSESYCCACVCGSYLLLMHPHMKTDGLSILVTPE